MRKSEATIALQQLWQGIDRLRELYQTDPESFRELTIADQENNHITLEDSLRCEAMKLRNLSSVIGIDRIRARHRGEVA
jgi:hypothetical protein